MLWVIVLGHRVIFLAYKLGWFPFQSLKVVSNPLLLPEIEALGLILGYADPFEIYHMSDIEAGLGLKRNHLIAISLLVGNDHDLNGVQGIGVDTAVRFVKAFGEDEILDKLSDIGRGDALTEPTSKENLQSPKPLHCSFCGHPGSKKSHLQFNCEFCDSTLGNGCTPKAIGFKCVCSSCDLGRKKKEVEKKENWHLKICRKIASEHNFPNNEIINILMSNDLDIDDKHLMSWARPKMDMLVDYLSYHLQWEPSYTRQRMFPMLSTIFLREVASSKANNDLLCGQYEFNSIQRVKIRYGHRFYLVRWSKPTPSAENALYTIHSDDEPEMQESGYDQSSNLLDDSDVPQVQIDNGCCFLCSDEDIELVFEAYPDKVDQFLKEKELKESKSKKKSSSRSRQTKESSESPASNGVQLSITEFYSSSKVNRTSVETPVNSLKKSSGSSSNGKRKEQTPKSSKSVRRRLLF
ncbi:exodeoxyribonuclease [Lithospermum erythrorhizon]|uniref:Exodeoxyribonuclease n=1 Tax=Lithospermum erythrorhizon TaxID=34254 RepID=A0AAV3NVA5_LITER